MSTLPGLEQREVGALERARGEQPFAKAQDHAVVVARVLVLHRIDLRFADPAARLRHQRSMQRQSRPRPTPRPDAPPAAGNTRAENRP